MTGSWEKEKVILLSNDDAASVLRAAVADIRRMTEGKFNIVMIKSTIDHDASGIIETMEDSVVIVSNIHGLHELIKTSSRLIAVK